MRDVTGEQQVRGVAAGFLSQGRYADIARVPRGASPAREVLKTMQRFGHRVLTRAVVEGAVFEVVDICGGSAPDNVRLVSAGQSGFDDVSLLRVLPGDRISF